MTTPAELKDLLGRITACLVIEEEAPANEGKTYHPNEPFALLAEAEDALGDMGMALGLIPRPRTVSNPAQALEEREWSPKKREVMAATTAQVAKALGTPPPPLSVTLAETGAALAAHSTAREKARALINKGLVPCGTLFRDNDGVYVGLTIQGRVMWYHGYPEPAGEDDGAPPVAD